MAIADIRTVLRAMQSNWKDFAAEQTGFWSLGTGKRKSLQRRVRCPQHSKSHDHFKDKARCIRKSGAVMSNCCSDC